jgi:hypothetical protein
MRPQAEHQIGARAGEVADPSQVGKRLLAATSRCFGRAVAGWARPRWLQWAAATIMLALALYFLATYAIPGS